MKGIYLKFHLKKTMKETISDLVNLPVDLTCILNHATEVILCWPFTNVFSRPVCFYCSTSGYIHSDSQSVRNYAINGALTPPNSCSYRVFRSIPKLITIEETVSIDRVKKAFPEKCMPLVHTPIGQQRLPPAPPTTNYTHYDTNYTNEFSTLQDMLWQIGSLSE